MGLKIQFKCWGEATCESPPGECNHEEAGPLVELYHPTDIRETS